MCVELGHNWVVHSCLNYFHNYVFDRLNVCNQQICKSFILQQSLNNEQYLPWDWLWTNYVWCAFFWFTILHHMRRNRIRITSIFFYVLLKSGNIPLILEYHHSTTPESVMKYIIKLVSQCLLLWYTNTNNSQWSYFAFVYIWIGFTHWLYGFTVSL